MSELSLEEVCQIAIDTLGAIDEWLGSASTREAAMDSIWRLSRALKQAGYEYDWRNALEWRGASMKELNEAGFFKNQDDGLFHFDPTADKEKPYRIYGNAQGLSLGQYVADREAAQRRAAGLQAERDNYKKALQSIYADGLREPREKRSWSIAMNALMDDMTDEYNEVEATVVESEMGNL